jgi:hypothetical protein
MRWATRGGNRLAVILKGVAPSLALALVGFGCLSDWVQISRAYPLHQARMDVASLDGYYDEAAWSRLEFWFGLLPGGMIAPAIAWYAATTFKRDASLCADVQLHRRSLWLYTKDSVLMHATLVLFLMIALGIGLVYEQPSWRNDYGVGFIFIAGSLGVVQALISTCVVLPNWMLTLSAFVATRWVYFSIASLFLLVYQGTVFLAWMETRAGPEDSSHIAPFLYMGVALLNLPILLAWGRIRRGRIGVRRRIYLGP